LALRCGSVTVWLPAAEAESFWRHMETNSKYQLPSTKFQIPNTDLALFEHFFLLLLAFFL